MYICSRLFAGSPSTNSVYVSGRYIWLNCCIFCACRALLIGLPVLLSWLVNCGNIFCSCATIALYSSSLMVRKVPLYRVRCSGTLLLKILLIWLTAALIRACLSSSIWRAPPSPPPPPLCGRSFSPLWRGQAPIAPPPNAILCSCSNCSSLCRLSIPISF